MEPLVLTDLVSSGPGVRRALHGYGTAGSWRRMLSRYRAVFAEIAAALPRDLWRALSGGGLQCRVEVGMDPAPRATSIALYAHFSRSDRVSEMVFRQLRAVRDAGFTVVFVSAADVIRGEDWQKLLEICAIVLQRQNFGLDFGGWRDAVPELRRAWPDASEVLLLNDSVLGPIQPLGPIVAAMREGGNGVFGLTESLQGGAHLQSFFLLARGKPVVADLLLFLRQLYVGHSKWLLVQRAELRLGRWMQARGHRVAALFGYDRVVREALRSETERRFLTGQGRLADLDRLPTEAAEALLHTWPLNPTQHFWHVLAARMGFPYLKATLVRDNPGHLPGVDAWPELVPPEAPCGVDVLRDHLATLARR